MLTEKTKKYLSIAGLLYCSLILGTHYVITQQLAQSTDPIVLTGYRFLTAALPLFVYLLFIKKNPFTKIKPGLVLGFFLWLVFVLIAKGVTYTSASNAGFISGAFIVFVPILSYLFFRNLPKAYHYFVIAISLLGLYFLTGQLQRINVGDIMILFSALFTAVHLVSVSRYAKQGLDPVVLCFQQFAVVFALSFAFALVAGTNITFPSTQIVPLLFLGLFATLSAFFVQIISLKNASEITAAIILALQPVFAAIFAVLFNNESITAIQMFGGFLLLAATIINQVYPSVFRRSAEVLETIPEKV